MNEVETENSSETEVAPPVEQVDVNQDVAEKVEQQEPQEDAQERNWRAQRQRQAELERQVKEKDEQLRLFMKAFQQKEQPKQVEEDDPEDEYANYAGVKKHARKVVEPLEQEVQMLKQQLAYNNLLKKFPDYESVMTADAISLFEQEEPELAQIVAELKDPIKMGIQTYKYVKALNIGDKVPNARRVREVEKKLEKNQKTVQSPMAYDKRPMAQAFKDSEADKKALYEEMMGFAQQAGSGF